MEQKLGIYFCNYLLPEAAYLLRNGHYPDVRLKGFPVNCSKGCIHFEKALNVVMKDVDTYSKVIIITSACSEKKHSTPAPHHKIEIIRLAQCFEILTNLSTIHYLIQKGNYLVTNGWLKYYKRHIREWGFDEGSAKAFFGESVKQILLLETGLPGNYLSDLEALSSYMGLAYDVLPIGSSHLKSFIDVLVYKWRGETERTALNDRIANITRESADYSVLFSQLKRLIDLTDEDLIVKEIAGLLDILFMPKEISYQKRIQDAMFDKAYYKEAKASEVFGEDSSIVIDMVHRKELLGSFHVAGIHFPEYMKQYNSMKQVISQIGGLAIINARKYSELDDARLRIGKSEAELRELNATKDKFFSIIAHDLKSPFNSIIGFSELLASKSRKKDYEGVEKYAGIIWESSQRAMDLLMNLLEWSRSQTGRIEFTPEYFNLADLASSITQLFDDVARQKGITLKTDIPLSLTVFADKQMINTVLRNLISNAIKFTHTKGTVTLTAEEGQHGVTVSITDDGVGISPSRIDTLFRLDQSVSTSGTAKEKGTGLGLILCKEFIDKHGGRMFVESQEGQGSVFSFMLPVKPLPSSV